MASKNRALNAKIALHSEMQAVSKKPRPVKRAGQLGSGKSSAPAALGTFSFELVDTEFGAGQMIARVDEDIRADGMTIKYEHDERLVMVFKQFAKVDFEGPSKAFIVPWSRIYYFDEEAFWERQRLEAKNVVQNEKSKSEESDEEEGSEE